MDTKKIQHPEHACQYCGSEVKLVETIIDDEFVWDEHESKYVPNRYTDQFEHTGAERCALCNNDWTGASEQIEFDG